MPPCGSPLMTTTNSVAWPVSRLKAFIRHDQCRAGRHDLPRCDPMTSLGMEMRSSAALASRMSVLPASAPAPAAGAAGPCDSACDAVQAAVHGNGVPAQVGLPIRIGEGREDVGAQWFVGIGNRDRAIEQRLHAPAARRGAASARLMKTETGAILRLASLASSSAAALACSAASAASRSCATSSKIGWTSASRFELLPALRRAWRAHRP